MNIAQEVWSLLDSDEKRKLKKEEANHAEFFTNCEHDSEHWVATFIEDGEVAWYRDEAFRWYYRVDSPEDVLEYIGPDDTYTIRLDRVEPDDSDEAEWVVKETNDFDVYRELEEFVEDHEQ